MSRISSKMRLTPRMRRLWCNDLAHSRLRPLLRQHRRAVLRHLQSVLSTRRSVYLSASSRARTTYTLPILSRLSMSASSHCSSERRVLRSHWLLPLQLAVLQPRRNLQSPQPRRKHHLLCMRRLRLGADGSRRRRYALRTSVLLARRLTLHHQPSSHRQYW